MLDDIIAKGIMIGIARGLGGLGRLEPHVVPTEILEAAGALAEALGPHRRARCALACKKTGGKGGERLGFAGHLVPPY